ncbi:hypothetical protein C8R43DRAFT_1137070 [Mycena crocata]|nr:hypothetical protein C8R43DRAFT_1137070 [Mycena crocata]
MLFTVIFAAVTLHVVSASPCTAGHGAVEPGFEWCYRPNMSGKCVAATTPSSSCVNIGGSTHPDNDQAASATTNFNSVCQLFMDINCSGFSIQIDAEETVPAFTDLGFDKLMSSYRCEFKEPDLQGFTWCSDENMDAKCIAASTAEGECVTLSSTAENDKASSAMTNPGAQCVLFQNAGCAGKSILLPALSAAEKFSDLLFDNMMSSYRCTSVRQLKGPHAVYGLYEQF